MGKTGKVELGKPYVEKMDRLCALTGRRGHPAAIRSIVDAVLFDAEILGISQVEPQAVGIKILEGAKRAKKQKTPATK